MLKSFLSSSVAAIALLGAGTAFALTEVRSVNVDVNLTAIGNERAAQYWTNIAADLETALISRLTDQIVDEGGASVTVDIEELSLASAFEEAVGIEDTKLVGQVSVLNLADQSEREFYELTISYDQAVSFIPTVDGQIVTVSMDDRGYYEGMIAAFADNLVAKLQ